MHHVNPDVLALLAMGENAGTPDEVRHVESCGACTLELQNLSRTAVVGRSALSAGELLEPPSRVWSRIGDELGLGGLTRSEETRTIESATEVAPVTSLAAVRRKRTLATLLVAAAVVVIVGGVGAVWSSLRPSAPDVLASATLTAFPAWTGATGEALLERTPAGGRIVQVSLETPVPDSGYREVWLITSDTTDLVSLGVLDGDSGTFTVPDGLDISRYDQVDISSERFDGDPDHSGDSILRGTLS